MRIEVIILAALALLPISCGQSAPAEKPASTSETQAPATTAMVWSSGFNVMGDGYPRPGDACRRLGETALTNDYLDDSAILVGCPGDASDAAAMALVKGEGARFAGVVEGVTMLSIPRKDANAGMSSPTDAAKDSTMGSPSK